MRKDMPKRGQLRVAKRFLFLPEVVQDQMRWLETVYVVEHYVGNYDFFGLSEIWQADRWSTAEEYAAWRGRVAAATDTATPGEGRNPPSGGSHVQPPRYVGSKGEHDD